MTTGCLNGRGNNKNRAAGKTKTLGFCVFQDNI